VAPQNNGMSAAPDSFQVSPQQQDLWEAEPDGPTARTQAVLAVEGEVSRSAIQDALRLTVERHESLRTTFVRRPGLTLPLQVVHELLEPRIETLDLGDADPAQRAQDAARVLKSELEAPFDFERGPLVRAKLLIKGRDASELIVTVSALCADQVSVALLLEELATHLAANDLVQDPLQYADFSAWQHELGDSDGDEARAARAFWRELADIRSPALPFTRPRAGSAIPQEVTIGIDDVLAHALSDQATRCGASPAAFAQAAWHAVLGRFGGAETSVVAFVPGVRRHPDLEGAVGAFGRPVPIQARVDAARCFADLLAEIDRARADALVNQDYAPAGAAGAVEIGFIEHDRQLSQPAGMHLTIQRMLRAGPEFGLFVMCGTLGDRLTLSIGFDSSRYGRDMVDRLAEGLVRTLGAAATDSDLPIADVELLGDGERRRVLREFNDTAAAVPQACAHELVARWALEAPDRPAVIDGTGSITYGELDARANQLANRLRAHGVGPDVRVGLCTDRSIEMMVALLGILKAGGAYVPLNSEHPPARLRHQLLTAEVRAVVTQAELLGNLPPFEGEVVCVDRDRGALQREPAQAPETGISSDNLAYVIYTSGSTGVPKGVSVTHRNLVNYAACITHQLGADRERLSFGLATAISTDLGNTSVFGALCSGGTLVIIGAEAAADPGAFASVMEANQVDIIKITPSHLSGLLATDDRRLLPRRWLVIGGERADWELIERVRALSSCGILNHYGPTEATVGCCTFVVGEGAGEHAPASVPIGRPIFNTSCYVLEDSRRLAPVGVPGKLFIAGAGVARGYSGEPELTREKFCRDPFTAHDEARMYDTGDVARWLPDGALEFLGRVDEQVKVRGYRVEPAEIETALRSHPNVQEAATATMEAPGGDLRLVAYCTVDGEPDQSVLRAHLAEWLPEFMLPAAIVMVEELPRTPSGKIDKRALPEPELAQAQRAGYIAPRTPAEEAVAVIWARVLGLPRVGVEEDFFALGGHSLLATRVVAQVRSDFAVELPLHSLFTCPTVASLADEIVRMMGAAESAETARLMTELEGMSDEEAERLLAEDLPPGGGWR
jgi:amino acid adenylation domain-containing protein